MKPVEETGQDQSPTTYVVPPYSRDSLMTPSDTREPGTHSPPVGMPQSPKHQHRKSPEKAEEEETSLKEAQEKSDRLNKQIKDCINEKQTLLKERQKLQHDLDLAKETIDEARRDNDQVKEVLLQKEKALQQKDEELQQKDQLIESLEREIEQLRLQLEHQASHSTEHSSPDHEISELQLGVKSMQASDIDGLPIEHLVTGAFANVPPDQVNKLKKHIVTAEKVRPLGVGTYGTVWELRVNGKGKAAGKEYRSFEIPVSLDEQVVKFCKEVNILVDLKHVHIVAYCQICFVPGSTSCLPMLVMELLETNLHKYLLERSPSTSTKLAILLGISKGLDYLHAKVIIHRDLTAKNILLTSNAVTSDPVAKISDFGNSKIINSNIASQLNSMSANPGNLLYMPPEAASGSYTSALDIFSFGHLALFTVTQKLLLNLPAATYYDTVAKELKAWSEVDRRTESFDIMRKQLGEDHSLILVITECLHNVSDNRPSAEGLTKKLHLIDSELSADVDDKYPDIASDDKPDIN